MACPREQTLAHICLQTCYPNEHCFYANIATRRDKLSCMGLPLSCLGFGCHKIKAIIRSFLTGVALIKRFLGFFPGAKVRSVDGKYFTAVLAAAVPYKRHYLVLSTAPFTGIINHIISDLTETISSFSLRSSPQNFTKPQWKMYFH